jgi:tetratricopeptide (TPR) repeat protein
MEEEAVEVWKKLLSLSPDSKYIEMINAKKNSTPDYASFYSPVKQTLFTEGKRLHELATAGDKKASQWAHDLWKRAYQAYSNDPVATAYYGSSIALLGLNSVEPQRMFESIFQGLKLINTAVDLDPDNIEVRLVRAYLLYSLPESMFHMTEKAISDFEYVITEYRKKTDTTITEKLYHQILYDLGMAYRRIGSGWKAIGVWQTLLNESSDPKYQELKERMYRV